MSAPALPSSPDAPRRAGHETSDANPIAVSLFGLALVLMLAVVLPLLGWLLWWLDNAAAREDAANVPSAVETGAVDQTPPEPRLQSDPAADLMTLRAEDEARLSTYGWVDKPKSVVRIPVDRAIDLLAERGLPEPKGPYVPPSPRERAP